MAKTMESTPRADGFRMPGEFEPHSGCWMLWPQRTDNWRYGAKYAQKAFVQVATAVNRFDPVTIGVNHDQFHNARSMLPAEIRVVEITNDDAWMRDCGPTFIINDKGDIRLVDWDFNAWGGIEGGLYFPWDKDDLVPYKISEMERIDRYKAPFVLEGGSIHVDGEGTLITTEECLLNHNRNPELSRGEIEQYLMDYLDLEKIIWLPRGTYNDKTDGHVDNICCYVRPGVVALTWTDDKKDPQYEISREAYEVLERETDAMGRSLEIHKIYQPTPVLITEEEAAGVDSVEGTLPRQVGDRLAASYINFYIATGGIVAPQFNDPADGPALDKLRELFPNRTVVGLSAREILLGGGNIHCITQQQPRPRKQ